MYVSKQAASMFVCLFGLMKKCTFSKFSFTLVELLLKRSFLEGIFLKYDECTKMKKRKKTCTILSRDA